MAKSAKKDSKSQVKSVRRNRTAYNFFYKHQRSLILQDLSANSNQSVGGGISYVRDSQTASILLWLDDKGNKHRRHRKTHGMIGLQELTKAIALRWKHAYPDMKGFYQELAKVDAARYKKDLQVIQQKNTNRSTIYALKSKPNSSYVEQDEFSPRRIEDMLNYPDFESWLSLSSKGVQCLTRNDLVYYTALLLSES